MLKISKILHLHVTASQISDKKMNYCENMNPGFSPMQRMNDTNPAKLSNIKKCSADIFLKLFLEINLNIFVGC